jgi:hypothetical protein
LDETKPSECQTESQKPQRIRESDNFEDDAYLSSDKWPPTPWHTHLLTWHTFHFKKAKNQQFVTVVTVVKVVTGSARGDTGDSGDSGASGDSRCKTTNLHPKTQERSPRWIENILKKTRTLPSKKDRWWQ